MSELLLAGNLAPEQVQYAGLLRASGKTILSIINKVLDFSSLETKNIVLETKDVWKRTCLSPCGATQVGCGSYAAT